MAAETPLLDDAKKTLSAADGLIVVTPIFQGSYSGLFKMFFDSLDTESINDMPTERSRQQQAPHATAWFWILPCAR